MEAGAAEHAHDAAEGENAEDDEGPCGACPVDHLRGGGGARVEQHISMLVVGHQLKQEEPNRVDQKDDDAEEVGPYVDGFIVKAEEA